MSQNYYNAALTFQKVHPKEFLNKFLMQGLRPDSRKFEECRQIDIVMSNLHYPYFIYIINMYTRFY
jgi:polyribonucleotide nucleotidyltransferase